MGKDKNKRAKSNTKFSSKGKDLILNYFAIIANQSSENKSFEAVKTLKHNPDDKGTTENGGKSNQNPNQSKDKEVTAGQLSVSRQKGL